MISADLDEYVAPADINVPESTIPMGGYTDAGVLVVPFKDSQLEKALLELAGYALSGSKDLFLPDAGGNA